MPFEHSKFKIGKSIIEGQALRLKFAELLYPVYNIRDFSQLPIGADLSTGTLITFFV